MTTIVKAADAAQFLSIVPPMIGFRPRQSIVLIPFAQGRSIGAFRFDLGDDLDADARAGTCIGLACRLPSADAVAAVLYTDAPVAPELPHPALVAALRKQAEACGLGIVDILFATDDAWGSYLDERLPPGGHAIAELDESIVGHADLEPPVGDQLSGATLPAATDAEREAVADALDALDAAIGMLSSPKAHGRSAFGPAADRARPPSPPADRRVDPRGLAAACALDDLPRLFDDALAGDPDELTPFEAAVMVWTLSRPSIRDVGLITWASGVDDGNRALDAQLRWENGAAYPEELGMVMWGEGARPQPQRLGAALALCRRVSALAPKGRSAGPLAMCAWLAWALGRSTHAESYAARARDADPEHGLAEIVLSFVAAGHLPDWAFAAR